MDIIVEAVYEGGVLKPVQPVSLKEHETVLLTIRTGATWVERTYGLCGFKGDAALAELFAMDPELDFPPPPEDP